MDDEEFKAMVLSRFDQIDRRFDHVDGRLDAIVRRIDEQDSAHDRLLDKVDRLSVAVRQSLEASETALSSITHLSRRVTRLEKPDE